MSYYVTKIHFWNPERGFGFCRLDEKLDDTFIHAKNFIPRLAMHEDVQGEEIVYEDGLIYRNTHQNFDEYVEKAKKDKKDREENQKYKAAEKKFLASHKESIQAMINTIIDEDGFPSYSSCCCREYLIVNLSPQFEALSYSNNLQWKECDYENKSNCLLVSYNASRKPKLTRAEKNNIEVCMPLDVCIKYGEEKYRYFDFEYLYKLQDDDSIYLSVSVNNCSHFTVYACIQHIGGVKFDENLEIPISFQDIVESWDYGPVVVDREQVNSFQEVVFCVGIKLEGQKRGCIGPPHYAYVTYAEFKRGGGEGERHTMSEKYKLIISDRDRELPAELNLSIFDQENIDRLCTIFGIDDGNLELLEMLRRSRLGDDPKYGGKESNTVYLFVKKKGEDKLDVVLLRYETSFEENEVNGVILGNGLKIPIYKASYAWTYDGEPKYFCDSAMTQRCVYYRNVYDLAFILSLVDDINVKVYHVRYTKEKNGLVTISPA